MGKLIQYDPNIADKPFDIAFLSLVRCILVIEKLLSQVYGVPPVSRKQHFSFRIVAFAEDEKLMNEFLQKPPNWLLKKGDVKQQIEYLKAKVLIDIHEKLDLEIDPNFVGYIAIASQVRTFLMLTVDS